MQNNGAKTYNSSMKNAPWQPLRLCDKGGNFGIMYTSVMNTAGDS